MTTEEFSNEFDVALNSYSVSKDLAMVITLDEYEKSIFLTKAQEELITSLYNGNNPTKVSFESTEEVRRYLSPLVVSAKVERFIEEGIYGKVFELPNDLWYITYEEVEIEGTSECNKSKRLNVFPVTQDTFYKIKNNPFRGAGDRRALRLDLSNNKVEIVSEYNINKYIIRYLKKPNPIILVDLPEDLSINNIKEITECELHPALHRTILDRAVQLAVISKTYNRGNAVSNEQ